MVKPRGSQAAAKNTAISTAGSSKPSTKKVSTQKRKGQSKSDPLEKAAEIAANQLPHTLTFLDDDNGDIEDADNDDVPKKLGDDPMGAEIEKSYLGTVIMSVVPLNPKWGDGIAANRPLNQSNVDALKASFGLALRRFQIDTRLKASVDPDVFGTVLDWNQADWNANQTPYRDFATEAKSAHYALTRDQIPKIEWVASEKDMARADTTIDIARPTLEAGQHRRAALMQHYNVVESVQNWTNPNTEWAVDFYDETAFDAEVRNALRTNKQGVFMPASDGEMMASFIQTWISLSPQRRHNIEGNARAFHQFLDSIGYSAANRTRIPNLTRNKTIALITTSFVSLQWGKQVFTLSTFDKMASSRLPEFWHDWFETNTFSALRNVFGPHGHLATKKDIHLLARAWGTGSSDMYTQEALKPLFFPTPDEMASKNPRWLTPADKKLGSRSLSPPIRHKNDFEATNRHPSLLEGLDDQEYYEVFCRLIDECKLVRLMEWPEIAVFIRQVEYTLPKILVHVIYWFHLLWRKPGNASKDLPQFSFVQEIAKHVIKKRALEKVTRGQDLELVPAALKYVQELVQLVIKDYDMWTEKSLEGWLEPPYAKFGEAPSAELGFEYRERFTIRIWIDLALLTAEWTGWTWVNGYMAPYLSPEDFEDDRKPYTVWGSSLSRTMRNQNYELHKLQGILTKENVQLLEREGSLFGAAYSYYVLKKALTERQSDEGSLPTPSAKSTGGTNSVALSEEDAEAVRNQLQVYSSFLNRNGCKTNPSQPDEPTQYLLFSSSLSKTDSTPRRVHTAADLEKGLRTPVGRLKRPLSLARNAPPPKFPRLDRERTPDTPTDDQGSGEHPIEVAEDEEESDIFAASENQ